MAIDRPKIQKQADAFMASGKIEKAIDELLKLLEDKSDDFNLANRIGDAYLQLGKTADALSMFKRAGLGYERQGFTNKAAAVFKKAHRAAPDDVDVAIRLAETYRATNMIKDAIQVHIELAESYSKKGLLKRALEEFAKVVELDPKHLKNKLKLADLYNKEGMKERASDIYLEVAESLAFEQMHAEAFQILERAKAMTSSPKLYLTQSRLCIVQKDLAGATLHLREGLAANPRSIEILEALAEVELQAKSPEKAMEALGQIPQLPDKCIALCERALREMVRANAADEGLRLFKPIGRDFARRGLGDQAARVLRGSFQNQSLPTEAWLQLAEIAHQSGDGPGRIDALSRARAQAVAANDSALIRSLEAELQSLGVAAAQIEAAPAPAPVWTPPAMPEGMGALETTEVDPVRRMQIQQLEKDAESFMRSRFNDRAQDCYQKILELDPTHMNAITRIADILRASGVMTKVQQHYVKTAEKLAGVGQRHLALMMLDKAEELFPGSTRLHRRMLGLLEPVPAPAAPAPQVVPAPLPPAPESIPAFEPPPMIALGAGESLPGIPMPPPPAEVYSDLDVLIALDQPGALPVAPEVPEVPAPLPGVSTEELPMPLLESLEPDMLSADDLVWTPPAEEPEVAAAVEPEVVEVLEELEPLELEPLPFLPKPTIPMMPPPMVLPPVLEPLPEPAPLAAGPVSQPLAPAPLSEELLSLLSDIDFQLDYGSPEEAKIEIEHALKTWPEHPELMERLERAEESMRRLGLKPAPQSLADDEEFAHSFFDLTDVLGDALLEPGEGEEMHDATNVVEKIHSVDELFNAFREGVEQQVKVDDYDTHYNLGIAYKEMMLIEPALEEFKKAMRDPERTLECCSMLAICEQAQGNNDGAEAWLRQGIDAPGFPPEDSIGLRYDLAEILLQVGRVEEAREHFLAVQELDPDYRDVAKRLM